MKLNFKDSGLTWLWLTVIFLVLDQVTKQWIVQVFAYRETYAVMPFFNLTYAQNPGAAFSFLADQPGWQRWFFTAVSTIASIVFIVWMSRTPKANKLLGIGFALLLSGAVGNLIDRVLFGYVIDFLDFYVGTSHWPAFNIADSVILIGAGLMIIESFVNSDEEKDTSKVQDK